MSEFSITEAAFSGLRLAREKPVAIAIWSLAYLAVSLGTVALMVNMAGPALAELQQLQAQARADPTSANPTATLALLGQILPFYVMLIPISILCASIAMGAVTRAVLRPSESAVAYLRLGPDELRLIVVVVVIGLIMGAVYLGSVLVMGIIVGVVGAAAGRGAVMPALIGVMCLIVLGLYYLGTRFSLAPALTLDRKGINIFGSWALTKGRSGRIFLTYLLALVVYLVIVVIGLAIAAGAAVALGGGSGGVMAMFQPDTSSLATVFTPAMIIYYLIMSVIGGVGLAVQLAPPAFIYQALVREGAADVF